MDWKDIILSKRVVGSAVAAILYLLAKSGIIVPAGMQDSVVEGVIQVAGVVWIVVTKMIDSYQASKSAPAPAK